MTLEEFEILIARHGAETSAWPAADRAAGEALLARSDAARALLAEQARIDRLIAEAPAIAAPQSLRARVLAATHMPEARPAPARRPLFAAWRESFAGFWPQMAGLAAAVVIGFTIGVADVGFVPVDEGPDFSAYIVGYGDETSLAALIGEP